MIFAVKQDLAWCKHANVSDFSCRFLWLRTVSYYLAADNKIMWKMQGVPGLVYKYLWSVTGSKVGRKLGSVIGRKLGSKIGGKTWSKRGSKPQTEIKPYFYHHKHQLN